jgi:hypothetical protein
LTKEETVFVAVIITTIAVGFVYFKVRRRRKSTHLAQ